MKREIDIHNSEKVLATMRKFVSAGASSKRSPQKPIPKRDADLILQYDTMRALAGIKECTRIADMERLLLFARTFGKGFENVDKNDIRQAILDINGRYSKWTAAKARMTFKWFCKWLKQGDDYLATAEFPEEVKWIKRGMRKREQPRVQRNELWSEDEIKKLIANATNSRDRVLVSLLTETGARIGEVGNLTIGDVYQDEFSFLIHLKGKTGERENRVVYSGPIIAELLNNHPYRDDPQSPLFLKRDSHEPLSYRGINITLKRIAKRAGLGNKRVNPHMFRHSKATQMVAEGWPEPLIKEYLGWDKDSSMLDIYSHITSRQANNHLLKMHGIKPKEALKPTLEKQICTTCHKENGPEAKFCHRCGRPLDHKTMLQYNHKKQEANDILNQIADDPEFIATVKRLLHKKQSVPIL